MLIQSITAVIVFVHFVTLSSYVGFCEATQRTLIIRTTSSSESLEGLGCAIERSDLARGVKFNTETKECESLTDAWFDDPTADSGHNYFKLFMVEGTLIAVNSEQVVSKLPRCIVVGFSLVFHFWRGTQMCCLYQDIRNEALDAAPFHMNFQHLHRGVLNAMFPPYGWGTALTSTNPFQSSNRLYKVKFTIGMTAINVMVDDAFYFSFPHRAPITAYEMFSFLSMYPGDDKCTKLQYYFPI